MNRASTFKFKDFLSFSPVMKKPGNPRKMWLTAGLTLLALLAFAANSVLCRMALGQETIDATSFTGIRLISGAAILYLLVQISRQKEGSKKGISKGSWISGMMLFLYAASFSYAYVTLDTGVGALILFASVQITMITYGFFKGRRLNLTEWTGVLLAFGGFVYLVSPGISAPSGEGFVLMTLSGFGWGVYSVRGMGSANPLEDTTFNFLRSNLFLFLFIALLIITTVFYPGFIQPYLSEKGFYLAVLSGGITSGLGYTIWYMALRGLSNIQASVVQLSVPVIAALAGILLLSEKLSVRLALSSVIILSGILLVIIGKSRIAFRK
jgi:drug/metabolite transporter (DMT)-like permease